MTKTNTEKLYATIVEVTDLGSLFPTPLFRGRIGLDVRVERGSLSSGKKVRILHDGLEEKLEILGIEMLHNAQDPNVVRILCSKCKSLALPAGKVDGWSLAEE